MTRDPAALAVLRAFTDVQLDLCGKDEAERGALERARELFLLAGAERLERASDTADWLEVGVAPRARGGDAAGTAPAPNLGDTLRGFVRRALAEGRVDRFFFMRKPPGLRLRFRGARIREFLPDLRAELAAVVDVVQIGPYDAETYQFGGETGLDIAHELFTHDSLAILDLLAPPAPEVDTSLLSLLVLSDLLRRVTGDPFERWDVWAQMKLTGRLPTPEAAREARYDEELDANRAVYQRILDDPDAVTATLPTREAGVVAAMREANALVAERWLSAVRSDRLLYPLRKILPFCIIFHWNRWGLDPDEQVALTYAMERLLDPKGE